MIKILGQIVGSSKPNLDEWIQIGVTNGFCSPVYCENHDGVHPSDIQDYDERMLEDDFNNDFCWAVVRIYNGS